MRRRDSSCRIPLTPLASSSVSQQRSSWVLGLIALLLTVPATLAIARVDSGLSRSTETVSGVPVTTLVADAAVQHPVVVVAHGFAGSAQLMDDLGVAIANAGYAVVLLDFRGHGRNGAPLPPTGTAPADAALDQDLTSVIDWAVAQPWAEPGHLALVGHSMGAGAVVRDAVRDASGDKRVVATVALSLPSADGVPVGSAQVPRDLLLLVGGNEGRAFTDAALTALRAAYPDGVFGPGYGSPAEGSARSAQQVPGSDHVTIVFSRDAAQATVDWLDETVGAPSSGHIVGGGRIGWLLVLTVGAAIGFVPLARLAFGGPIAAPPVRRSRAGLAWPVVTLVAVGASVAASLLTAALPGVAARVPFAVGGHVMLWFVIAGLGSFGIVVLARRLRLGAPAVGEVEAVAPAGAFPWRDLIATFVMTAYAVVALGLVAQHTWTAFVFVGDRERWLLLVELAFLVWFWADDRIVGARWWLAVLTRVIAVGTLMASVAVLGAPSFLTLLVPLMAVVLGLLLVYGQTVTRRSSLVWSAPMVQAIPLAYLVATTFPLVS